MRVPSPFFTAIVLAFLVSTPLARTDEQVGPASSLESRIGETPAAVLKMFAEGGLGTPTAHALTAEERQKLSRAFAALPPLHRRILGERLRTVSFLDGMPNTALTSTVINSEPYRLFDITIRAAVLGDNVSEFLTQKERTCFDTAGSSLSVSIEAGRLDAIIYVLLHEATHVVDSSLRIAPGEFTEGVWNERTIVAARYRDPLLARIRFRADGEVLSIDRADAVYAALRLTPFVSLYGSSNWHDDVAESVAWYHLTERLKQPYRIMIRNAGREVFAYEPMKSQIVRARFGEMDRFYEVGR